MKISLHQVILFVVMCCLPILVGCRSGHVEGRSLLGTPLVRPVYDGATLDRLVANLEQAQTQFEVDPTDEEAIIWLGRRLAYLGRYREAIDVFTSGLDHHPQSFRLRRHRGHRYITLRLFDLAIADFMEAEKLSAGAPIEVEPDGAPNALNRPIGTTQGNILYHLGLAHYLNGDFEAALDAYNRRMQIDRNDDNRCATAYWRYIILRRLDRPDDAADAVGSITGEMEVIENTIYHQLALLFKGERTVGELAGSTEMETSGTGDPRIDNPTLQYGLSMWYLFSGQRDQAIRSWREIVENESSAWAAFGYIAAEADLARMAVKR